jgi:hypothetical protein
MFTTTKLCLALAACSFFTAQAAPVARSEDPFAICKGFALESLGTSTIKLGDSVDVKWQVDGSLVQDFTAIELFNSQGLIKDLYIGHTPASELSKQVQVTYAENQSPNNGDYWFRIWGRTSKGPDCVLISNKFQLVQ